MRQDYLIAEGLLAPYDGETADVSMEAFALARLRQLSAHEVGHTLGLEHNFAASANDRASVMDYPHPLITLTSEGELDISTAYAEGIGEWDKRAILFGYQDFASGVDADTARKAILADTIASGLHYIGSVDAVGPATANPVAGLWDNGSNAIDELEHLIGVRRAVLDNFSAAVIQAGRPLATIEEALVPMYLLHRYQLQSAGKFIGGQYFSYAMRGDGQTATVAIPAAEQMRALDTLLTTLSPEFLALSPELLQILPPRPPGHPPTRELFARRTGVVFDPVAAAEASAVLTLEVLLNPERAARMNRLRVADATQPGFNALVLALLDATWRRRPQSLAHAELQRAVNNQVLAALLELVSNVEAAPHLRAVAVSSLVELGKWLEQQKTAAADWRAHYVYAVLQIEALGERVIGEQPAAPVKPPPGSPI